MWRPDLVVVAGLALFGLPFADHYAGTDNGWVFSLMDEPLMAFNKSIIKYPNMKCFPGGAPNDLMPNLRNPGNALPLLDVNNNPKTIGAH